MARQGVVVEPYQRLKLEQAEQIHRASLAILTDPGVVCFNRNAAEIFGDHGAEVLSIDQGGAAGWLLKIPEKVITDAVLAAPKVVKLGARNENNCLILDGREPRVRFVPGRLHPHIPLRVKIWQTRRCFGHKTGWRRYCHCRHPI